MEFFEQLQGIFWGVGKRYGLTYSLQGVNRAPSLGLLNTLGGTSIYLPRTSPSIYPPPPATFPFFEVLFSVSTVIFNKATNELLEIYIFC